MSGSAPILIMAGGTGGHVFPALALARLLRAADREVVWLGTRAGIEARVTRPGRRGQEQRAPAARSALRRGRPERTS